MKLSHLALLGALATQEEACLLGVERNCDNENTVALEVADSEGDSRTECVDPYLLDLDGVIKKFREKGLEVLTCTPSHETGYRDLTAEDIARLDQACEEVGF